jgi:hypothetical protein
VEARGRDRGGENLVGVNATRGSASGPPGKTGAGGTDPLDASTLGAATGVKDERASASTDDMHGKRQGGQVGWRHQARYQRGKPSEGEKPMDGTGMQQGRKVTGGIKASRG